MVKPINHVRSTILRSVTDHPADLVTHTARTFGMTRMGAHKHVARLVAEGQIVKAGRAKGTRYELAKIAETMDVVSITPETQDDTVWSEVIEPLLDGIPENVRYICYYGFTEMFNNVIDHSESDRCLYHCVRTPVSITFTIHDYGVGIFDKIAKHFNLSSRRHAILELSKGKLTSFPERHSGEGIFFTSRMFDNFVLLSQDLFYQRKREENAEWLIESDESKNWQEGTVVRMSIAANTTRKANDVFLEHMDDDAGFSRTHVPMTLAKLGEGSFVSRSQAKRVLARFEKFSEVFLDFRNVDEIGQAFADEIFRVYAKSHPGTQIVYVNANPDVERMIQHAKRNAADG
ncbi:hypothetical protein ASF36_23995 [Methylobacterium sp. Leaf90]|nr:hypothetical protein ASF36_23995 [Methylobacterium sp. Leaf90]